MLLITLDANFVYVHVFIRGSLQAERQDLRRMSTKLLTCTHTACGHSASVLSVHATQNLLFSASQGKYSFYIVWCTCMYEKFIVDI